MSDLELSLANHMSHQGLHAQPRILAPDYMLNEIDLRTPEAQDPAGVSLVYKNTPAHLEKLRTVHAFRCPSN